MVRFSTVVPAVTFAAFALGFSSVAVASPRITDIRIETKTGGKSGDFVRDAS